MKKLITSKVVATCVGTTLAREAFFLKHYSAGASVSYFFNLVGRGLCVLPDINKAVATVAKPIAILGFLFTGESNKSYKGDGNGKFFHMTKVINVPMLCKSCYK